MWELILCYLFRVGYNFFFLGCKWMENLKKLDFGVGFNPPKKKLETKLVDNRVRHI